MWNNFELVKPDGKYFCCVRDKNGNEIYAKWHIKSQSFIGMYDNYENMQLYDIEEWRYCLLKEGIPNNVQEALLLLNLQNGEQELTVDASKSDYGARHKLLIDILDTQNKIKRELQYA